MTLRVTVEMVPHGFEGAKRTLAVLEASNLSRSGDLSDYLIETQNETGASDRFAVEGHDTSDGWLPLLRRALDLLASRKPRFSVKL